MEGHQEVVAQQKAEEEALQRTPGAQAKREAEAKAEAERQRRIELARSGQMPRAQVVYLSPEEAAVGAGPQPPTPEPETEDVGEAEKAGGSGPIQGTIQAAETGPGQEPGPAPEPPSATPSASEAAQPAKVSSTSSQKPQRQAMTPGPGTPAEARRQIAVEPAAESSASPSSPAPATKAEAEPIPERPKANATMEPATEQAPAVQRAPEVVEATPPDEAEAGLASESAREPGPDLVSQVTPTSTPTKRIPEDVARTPARAGREGDAASTIERPKGLGRRLLDAARSLFRPEEEAAPPPPSEQQRTPAEPPAPSPATVQLTQESEEGAPAAMLETTYEEEQLPEAAAEPKPAADHGPARAAAIVQRQEDKAGEADEPGSARLAEWVPETEERGEPARVTGPNLTAEAQIAPASEALAEVENVPAPSMVEADKTTPATPAVQRQIEEPAGRRTATPVPAEKQPPAEEPRIAPTHAGSVRPEAADGATAEGESEATPSEPETPMSAPGRPPAVQGQLEGGTSIPTGTPEMRPPADEDATLVVPRQPEGPKFAGKRLERPTPPSDRSAEPPSPAEPAAVQREMASEEPGATGQDEGLDGQALPLEAVWPVTPTKSQGGVPAAEPAAGPAETGPHTAKTEAAGPTATEKRFVQRKIASEDKTSEDVHAALQKVTPGRDTDSAVELVTPRRPRPTVPVQRKIQPQTAPEAEGEAETPIQRQPEEEEDTDHREEAPQPPQGPGRASPREPTMIPTEIGDLPSDLWEILGERPPEPRPRPPVEGPGPADTGPTNGLVQRTEAAVAVQAPPRPPLEMVLGAIGLDDSFVQRVETAPTTAAETSVTDEPETKKAAEPDIDELAQKVYAEIKQRLIIEYERSRGRF